MNNPNLTLAGTGDFSLIVGATEAPAQEDAYDAASAPFGNLKEVVVLNEKEVKDHFGTYRGVRILDQTVVTQLRKGYRLKFDEFEERAVQALFNAALGEDTGIDPVYRTFTPFTQTQGLKGFGRVRLWDTRSQENPRMIHKDFLCIVRFEGDFTLGEDFSEYELKVDVLSPVGVVHLRKDAP